eukprot:scaffold44_cov339-Pavlova_lutheri.AAC.38
MAHAFASVAAHRAPFSRRVRRGKGGKKMKQRVEASTDVQVDGRELQELREENVRLRRELEQWRRTQEGDGQATERASRIVTRERKTKETNVRVTVNLDGTGKAENQTGVGFLDHMLDQLASHGLFDVEVSCKGDLWVDDHHTVEDVAITLGQAFKDALGDKKGIRRFGTFTAPLDEALVSVTLDLSGRPHTQFYGYTATSVEKIGGLSTHMVEHFFESFASTSMTTLHIQQVNGRNPHHIVEATFKAFARALRMATEQDPRNAGVVPSSKGHLTI